MTSRVNTFGEALSYFREHTNANLAHPFQRLKDEENDRLKLGWNLQRTISKINYRIHTDAIKANLIPPELSKLQINLVYASEADLLNMALFGTTAKDWRESNPDFDGNIASTLC